MHVQYEQLHNGHAVLALFAEHTWSTTQLCHTEMRGNRRVILALPVVAVVVSCQQGPPPRGSLGVRTYSDAVVHIGQVDPAYQAYFRPQNAANYSLNDQRRAYMAAAQTARTPVRASDYHPGDVRRVVSSSRRSRVSGKARVVRRKLKSSRRHAVASRKRSSNR